MSTDFNFEAQDRIDRAKAEVKKLKGFYSHLLVYVVINLMIVVINVQDLEPGESYFQFKNFFTLTFWGFGLLVHGLSVFLPNWVLGKNWEERKIKEYMERNKRK
ncbi:MULTISPECIES: 2TM domain-containing protein [Bizionia]|uniref:2TM domain-containing protein n=1 Tax=Bizionia algoritergicola TaxID=291187 RepID=A0A5D0QNK6_9FLAO|nr:MULTISPECIES: 2TM domain-containing protein [Bizionia]OBX22606.1 histidine kinase [Bizionia sp. APA-3]TYB70743.1 2TM domain-containing protein [Bizionia algoritergicola]